MRVATPPFAARAVVLVLSIIVASAACGPASPSYESLMTEGRTLAQGGEPGRALEVFLRAQRSHPQRKEPYVLVASLCESLGVPEVGIPVLREAVALDDDNRGPYHFMLAVLYEAADEPRAAEESYRSCIELEPEFAPARANLGQLLFASGRNREAVELMAETTRRFPADSVLRIQYGEMLLRDGSIEEAEAQVRGVLESGEPPPQTHYLMGLIDLQRNRYEEARARLERAVREDPEEMRAWYQLANACGRLRDSRCESRALDEFEKLFRRDVGDGSVD